MDKSQLEQLIVFNVRERKTDKALNKLQSILKKCFDRENILIIKGALLHLLCLNQALT